MWVNSPQTTTGKLLSGPHIYKGLTPHQHKQTLCEHSEPLCGLIDHKPLLENTFQGPMFIRGSPPTTQTSTVWAHTTIVWVNWPQITTGKQLSGPHVYQGPPPTIQTTTMSVHTTSVWVNWPENTTGKLLSGPHVYKGFLPININNHCVSTWNQIQCWDGTVSW